MNIMAKEGVIDFQNKPLEVFLNSAGKASMN
jgi:hypothetical protein